MREDEKLVHSFWCGRKRWFESTKCEAVDLIMDLSDIQIVENPTYIAPV
jgi:hypothetical protein